MPDIPITVIVVTKNEEKALGRCLEALQNFKEIIIVDSHSADQTLEVAQNYGARAVLYQWDGVYPKKRQWCLDNLKTKHDWIFFVDADEVLTPDLIEQLRKLDKTKAGYFIKGRYVWQGKVLRYGLQNKKLALFNKHKIEFPVLDDLDLPMGEIEGHYQPVLKPEYKGDPIGCLSCPLLHHAYEDMASWQKRHQKYALWEAGMIKRRGYPPDPSTLRQGLKKLFRRLPFRAELAFIHCFILKFGFMDGPAGYRFAKSRCDYYKMVSNALSASSKNREEHTLRSSQAPGA